MDKKTQRAWLFSAALILFSIFFTGGNYMKKISVEARLAFFTESPETGSSISGELNKLAANGRNLITVAKRAGVTKELDALDEALISLGEAESLAQKYEHYTAALEKTLRILDLSKGANASETDKGYLTSIAANVSTIHYKIENNEYNKIADEANAKLSGFPQSLIRAVRGIKAVEPFKPQN